MIKPYYETELGKLYHGDCLETMPKLEDKINLIITDPPYSFESFGGGFYDLKKGGRKYLNKIKKIKCDYFDAYGFLSKLKIKHGYFFCNKFLIEQYLKYARENNLLFDVHFMWKTNPIPAKNNHYLHEIEYIIYIKEKSSYFNNSSIFNNYKKSYKTQSRQNNIHPAQKPIGIIIKYIEISLPRNGIVLDCFAGSGTTAIACEQLNRKWIGIEISEEYCEIAAQRIDKLQTQDNQIDNPNIEKQGLYPFL